MGMYAKSVIISKNNSIKSSIFKINIKYLLSFDADVSGENGPNFVSQEAKDNGYDNDIEYAMSKLESIYMEKKEEFLEDIEDLEEYIGNYIKSLLEMLIDKNYYDDYEYIVEITDKLIIVFLAVHSKD